MRKIRKGDEVIVTTGKDKGRRGVVLRVIDQGEKLVIEGINRVKKHVKPNPMKNIGGGIVEREAAVHISNVALWNSVAEKGDRVGFKTLEDGRKVRVFKSNGEIVDA
ncbi:MAG: 50S ribosomal protein L24 [Proteobacteria bacterium]|nr:50S ribosomal protein L24 [Pseudomonadota bacterium]MDE3208485.1 50S ribosomal protein L24 [Pseudomonadota bacterium]